MVQVQGCPIAVNGPATEHYLEYIVKVQDNRIQNCGLESKLYMIPGATDKEKEEEKEQTAQAYSRIGGQPKAMIMLKNLHLYDMYCFRNTISKGSSSGITLVNVKGFQSSLNKPITLPTTEQEAQSVL